MFKKPFQAPTKKQQLTWLAVVKPVYAAIENPVVGDLGTSEGAADGSKFVNYVVYLWRASMILGALAVIIYFILGAFEWITASGDQTKIQAAISKITNSAIGLVLLVSSFVIIGFISRLVFGDNFNILQLTIPGI